MLAGSIKFFVADKGYGFILPDDGTGDVFFHHRAVDNTGDIAPLAAGDRVEFELELSDGKRKALRVKLVERGNGGNGVALASSPGSRPRGNAGRVSIFALDSNGHTGARERERHLARASLMERAPGHRRADRELDLGPARVQARGGAVPYRRVERQMSGSNPSFRPEQKGTSTWSEVGGGEAIDTNSLERHRSSGDSLEASFSPNVSPQRTSAVGLDVTHKDPSELAGDPNSEAGEVQSHDGQGSNLALSDEGVEPVIESATLISMDEERPHPDDSDGSCHLTQESEERGRICQSNADLSSLAVEVGLDHDEFDEDAQDPVGLNESVDGTSGSDGQTSAQERTKNISASNGNPDPDSGKGDDSVAGESDNVSDEDEERNPRKRRRTTQLIDGRTQASNSRPSCDITADANAASSSTNTKATVPVTASAPASAPTDAKIRVFLPVCETRIDVRLSLTLLQVVRWEQAKKRKEAESRGLRYRATEVAAAWVHRVPMPLSRTFDELTEGSMRVKWEVAVEPIPIASTWGMEVCRRTLILAISLAASRIRGSNPSLGILSVRATTAHGIYLSMASSLREADLRKVASALRAALTEVVSSAVPTRTRKLAALEAAAYFSRQGLVLSETMVLSKNRLVLTCDTVGDSAVALVHGSYTSVLLPSLSDLRDASIGVYPIATSSGLFVKFASPGSQQLPFGDVEERALLVAIGELDDQSRLLQVGNVAKLNDIVGMGEYACKRHIELAEAQLGRRLGAFAERVLANRPRLIMISAPPCGGVEWLAHALELQLRLRELRGVCINAAHWARPAGVLRIAEMLADLGTLFATGKVQLRGLLRDDGSMGAPSCVDLPAGGYVILYGEQLQDGLQMATENPNPLRDLPAPQFRVQAMPLCCVAIDEHACIGGGSFLLLRLLAKAFADGKCVVTALRVWVSKRSIQRERALEHIDLTLVGSAMSDEWKPLNLSFAYELSLYAQLLSPALKSIPFGDEVYSEARHLLDMLSEFRGMPLDYVPLQSLVRSFCGGAWLPIR